MVLTCWNLKSRLGLLAEIDSRDQGLGSQPNIPDSLAIGVKENWNGNYDKHLGSLGNKGRRLNSGSFLRARGSVRKGRANCPYLVSGVAGKASHDLSSQRRQAPVPLGR